MRSRRRGQGWGLRGPDAWDHEADDPGDYDRHQDSGTRPSLAGGSKLSDQELRPLGGLENLYRSCPWCRIDCCAFH